MKHSLLGLCVVVLGVGACGSGDTHDGTQPVSEGESAEGAVEEPEEGDEEDSADPEPAASGVEVLDSGFGQQDICVSPVVQLQSSPGDAGKFATVTFNLLDESGELLATTEQV